MKPKTIQQFWTDYQRLCLPPNAGAVQVKETRQAFFAGFSTMFCIFEALSEPNVSEARAVEILKFYKRDVESEVIKHI